MIFPEDLHWADNSSPDLVEHRRDVVYETVLLRLRRTYHAQAAAWLEAHAGEEKYRVSAFREALAAFERALGLLERDVPLYMVPRVRIGYTLCQMSDYLLAQQHLQEAPGLARAHPAWNAEVEESAQPTLYLLIQAMPPKQLSAALDRGRALSLNETIRTGLALEEL